MRRWLIPALSIVAALVAPVGAIEGANGLLLFGWSTAFLISVTGRMRVLEHDWLENR